MNQYTWLYGKVDRTYVFGDGLSQSIFFQPPDSQRPSVELIGQESVTVNQNSRWEDPGALVSDDIDGERIIVAENQPNTAILGVHVLTYRAIDRAGNVSKVVNRNVFVRNPNAKAITALTISELEKQPYFDLLIVNDDIEVDVESSHAVPISIHSRASVAQDIKHMIRESGLLVQMLANRDQQSRARSIIEVVLLIEEDERIVPGTVYMTEAGEGEPGTWFITADTYEFGNVEAFF